MVNMSEEESVSPNRRDKGGASSEHFFSPADDCYSAYPCPSASILPYSLLTVVLSRRLYYQ
jgi:hypothetical protein